MSSLGPVPESGQQGLRHARFRRRQGHRATFGTHLCLRRRVRGAESAIANHRPMVLLKSKLCSTQQSSRSMVDENNRKSIHDFSSAEAVRECCTEIQARRVGIARSVHVLAARKSNSHKNSARYAGLSRSMEDTPCLRPDARRNPRDECSEQHQSRTQEGFTRGAAHDEMR